MHLVPLDILGAVVHPLDQSGQDIGAALLDHLQGAAQAGPGDPLVVQGLDQFDTGESLHGVAPGVGPAAEGDSAEAGLPVAGGDDTVPFDQEEGEFGIVLVGGDVELGGVDAGDAGALVVPAGVFAVDRVGLLAADLDLGGVVDDGVRGVAHGGFSIP